MTKRSSIDEFTIKAKLIHGDHYDYHESVYTTVKGKINIWCNVHNETFEQIAGNHLRGMGCPKCGKQKIQQQRKSTFVEIVNKANKIHNHYYTYIDNNYTNNTDKLTIICPEHGEFTQRIASHLSGHNCSKCSNIQSALQLTKPIDCFISDARKVHNNQYDYSNVIYKNSKTQIDIICPIHGVFSQTPDVHINHSCGCPQCKVVGTSKAEQELTNIISQYFTILSNDRTLIAPKELDIVIPELKIAIEYCGLYWHSSDKKRNNYHNEKRRAVEEQGYRLITIFEDEWIFKKEIVINKLFYIFGISTQPKIYARKCEVIQLNNGEHIQFLDKNHIQGSGPCSIVYGLQCDNQLVAVMGFKKRDQLGTYELSRYATSCSVIGGFSKLLSYFTKNQQWVKIISFADLRWCDNTNNIYNKSGFVMDKQLPPDYKYIKHLNRIHKFNFRHKYLSRQLKQYDPKLSETQNTKNNKIYKIYDCGLNRYTLTNNKEQK